MHEALHRAQDLEQQLSAIQALQQTPASIPQQRQSASTRIAEQDLQQQLTATQAHWQAPSSSPQAATLGACVRQKGAHLTQNAVNTPEQAPGAISDGDLQGEHTPDPGVQAQSCSASVVSHDHEIYPGSIAIRLAQSSREGDKGGQQLEAMCGPRAMHSRGCFWRRVCPGIEVRTYRSSAHTTRRSGLIASPPSASPVNHDLASHCNLLQVENLQDTSIRDITRNLGLCRAGQIRSGGSR